VEWGGVEEGAARAADATHPSRRRDRALYCCAPHVCAAPPLRSRPAAPPQELIDKLMEGDKEKYTAGASGTDR